MIGNIKFKILKINGINRILLISVLTGIGMVVARIIYTGEYSYAFLIWNLFLAWVPFTLSSKLKNSVRLQGSNMLVFAWICLWLLFYPNAPYIVTDLFHLVDIDGAPKWFDLLLILNFVWNGLIMAVLSLHDMHHVVVLKKEGKVGNVFLIVVIMLTGFGVYLGRYERWNSWDLFINFRDLTCNIIHILFHPLENTRAYGFTFVFALFQGIIYFMFFQLARVISKQSAGYF